MSSPQCCVMYDVINVYGNAFYTVENKVMYNYYGHVGEVQRGFRNNSFP